MEFRRFGLDCYFWSSICPQNGLFLNFEGDLETTLTRFSPFLTFPTLSVDKSLQFVNPLLGYYPLLVTKGQLISKCLFGVIVWTKITTKILSRFLPWNFCSFFGASWELFGASCWLLLGSYYKYWSHKCYNPHFLDCTIL